MFLVTAMKTSQCLTMSFKCFRRPDGKVYTDNDFNRKHNRVGLPLGSKPVKRGEPVTKAPTRPLAELFIMMSKEVYRVIVLNSTIVIRFFIIQ